MSAERKRVISDALRAATTAARKLLISGQDVGAVTTTEAELLDDYFSEGFNALRSGAEQMITERESR